LKQFEVDRLQIVLEEITKNLNQIKLDYEKCNRKNEVSEQDTKTDYFML
jgi:hypothetical protein